MDERAKKQFFGAILDYLSKCESVWDEVIPVDSDTWERIMQLEQKYLGKWVPAASTLFEIDQRTSAALREAGDGEAVRPNEERPLSDALGRPELERIAGEVTDFVAAIPYVSTFWCELSGLLLSLPAPLTIGRVRLHKLPEEYVGPRSSRGYFEREAPPLRAPTIALELDASGYSRGRISDSSPLEALSTVKEFLVLAQAIGLLEHRRGGLRSVRSTPLCEVMSKAPSLLWVDDVPFEAARHIGGYRLGVAVRKDATASKVVAEDEQVHKFSEISKALVPAFPPAVDDSTRSLLAAAQWYFDSMAQENETTAFLFASLGLEALLGDTVQPEGVGVKNLLANRLAYLLGGKQSARKKVIDDFQTFYGKRSAIVHGREVRLQSDDRPWLTQAQKWLLSAIRKELLSLSEN